MSINKTTGFYTHAIHEALVPLRGAHKALYADSATAIFTYAVEPPKGNYQELTTEKVIDLLNSDRKDDGSYTTALKIQALQALIVFWKDREEHFIQHYQGVMGQIKRIASMIANYVQGHGWGIDDRMKERTLIRSQLSVLNTQIQKEEKEAAAVAAKAKLEAEASAATEAKAKLEAEKQAKLAESKRSLEKVTGNFHAAFNKALSLATNLLHAKEDSEAKRKEAKETIAAEVAKLKEINIMDQAQVKTHTPTERATPPPLPSQPTRVLTLLEQEGGKKAELAQILLAEGSTIDNALNGPCAQALCDVFHEILQGIELLEIKRVPTNTKGQYRYELILNKGRLGTLPGVPSAVPAAGVMKKKMVFTTEDSKGQKVITFLEKSVALRLGYSLASIDYAIPLHFNSDGLIILSTPLGKCVATRDCICNSISEIQWSDL